jgi:hypothetical protein
VKGGFFCGLMSTSKKWEEEERDIWTYTGGLKRTVTQLLWRLMKNLACGARTSGLLLLLVLLPLFVESLVESVGAWATSIRLGARRRPPRGAAAGRLEGRFSHR